MYVYGKLGFHFQMIFRTYLIPHRNGWYYSWMLMPSEYGPIVLDPSLIFGHQNHGKDTRDDEQAVSTVADGPLSPNR